jgi:hypothetical protein
MSHLLLVVYDHGHLDRRLQRYDGFVAASNDKALDGIEGLVIQSSSHMNDYLGCI